MIPELSKLTRPPRILILGSGGLSIGQAGEFDYSGSQAIRAMLDEGAEVIVINPNIATVQTNPIPGVKVFLYPVEPEWVEKIIAEEKPDAIAAGFGGQTALNCLIELSDQGILERYNVLNLGTPVEVLKMTEDRDAFKEKMVSIDIPVLESIAVDNVDAAVKAADDVGYPVIVRAAFALGGLGSGFANNREELVALAQPALNNSPQILVERSVKGWKEVEYEVMRDGEGNTITICNMENFDPLGIHTGDSIVVCPSQSLSDNEYQLLRNAALKIVSELGIVGECNVQYALDPHSLQYYVIEVNARLSRSSALASKASGYPIAFIAGKVVMGYDLLELKNPVTGITFAYFEPALDYITVKFPRWDLTKFPGVSRSLGSTMKSVGEVMSIGRSFPEAIQKAVRMVSENALGIAALHRSSDLDQIHSDLEKPTDTRFYRVIEALRIGLDIEEVHQRSEIDPWFLAQLRSLVTVENEIEAVAKDHKAKPNRLASSAAEKVGAMLGSVEEDTWRRWKCAGFADQQIAYLALRKAEPDQPLREVELQDASLVIRRLRTQLNVVPVVKKIDTTAAEYPSPSNYLYMSYHGQFHDPLPDDGRVFSAVVLGGGAYRIGTSVEFDWCAVSCSERLRAAGWRSVVVNCNPETVSTDYNSSDRLYFEELTLERILDVVEHERATGVVASMGGQLPNQLTPPLAKAGVKLLGHRPETVDRAEDRNKFSSLLDKLGIDQPRWVAASSAVELKQFVEDVGFPVLIRPSYVLSGAAMAVAFDDQSLEDCLGRATDVSSDHPIVVSEFIEGAREIELDGVAKDGHILTAIVSEHIENAGVHSGDATMVVPAQNLYVETIRRVRRAGHKIAEGLKLNGPFNMQFMAKEGRVLVIECNVRAARSFPFVSKTVGLNLADLATDVMIGREPQIARMNEDDLPFVGVKAAMFSFRRLGGADPVLGVEMASTGEVGCLAESFDEALLLALEATHIRRPKVGVLVSSGREHQKLKFLQSAAILAKLDLTIYATEGTAKYLSDHGYKVTPVDWPGTGEDDCLEVIRKRKVDLVINIPKSSDRRELDHGSQIRRAAAAYGCSLVTNIEKLNAFLLALDRCEDFRNRHQLIALPPFGARSGL